MGYIAPPVPVIDADGRSCANAGMTQFTPLEKFRVPIGGQEIELQQVDFDAGGMSFLRVRIREKTRFTIFDIDPATAKDWAQAMLRWAEAQPDEGEKVPEANVVPLNLPANRFTEPQ